MWCLDDCDIYGAPNMVLDFNLYYKILADRNVVDISWFDMPDIRLLSVHNTFIFLWLIPS